MLEQFKIKKSVVQVGLGACRKCRAVVSGRRASGFFGTAMTCDFEGLRILQANNAVKSGDWANYMEVLFGSGKLSVRTSTENATLSNEVEREDEGVVCGMRRPVQSGSEQSLGHTRQHGLPRSKSVRSARCGEGSLRQLDQFAHALGKPAEAFGSRWTFALVNFLPKKNWRSTALAVDRADHDRYGANQRARHVHGDPYCLVLVHDELCDGLRRCVAHIVHPPRFRSASRPPSFGWP